MSVKIIRLMSGEEIICNYSKNDDGTVFLKNPSILIPSPEGKLLLAKWIPYAKTDDGITLDSKHIVFVLDAQTELEQHFTNVVVNNIVVPGKKILDPSSSNLKLTV